MGFLVNDVMMQSTYKCRTLKRALYSSTRLLSDLYFWFCWIIKSFVFTRNLENSMAGSMGRTHGIDAISIVLVVSRKGSFSHKRNFFLPFNILSFFEGASHLITTGSSNYCQRWYCARLCNTSSILEIIRIQHRVQKFSSSLLIVQESTTHFTTSRKNTNSHCSC